MIVAHMVIDHIPLDVRVFYKECRSLAMAGHDVHLLVAGPCDEQRDGVRFHSCGRRVAPPKWPGLFRRLSILVQYLALLWGSYRAARAIRADVYHVHEPMLIIVGLLLKRRRVAVVYDAHEEYRQVALRVRELRPVAGRLLQAWYGILEHLARRRFDLIIAATPTIARQFPQAEVIFNYPMESEFLSATAMPYRDRPPHVIYAGGISRLRGIHEMVEAMSLLPAQCTARLQLIGRFSSPDLEHHIRRLSGWERVDFHGWAPREDVCGLLAQSRAGLVVLHPGPNHTEALPNKLFEYMAAGIPVVASDFPLWRDIVGGAGCGLLVDPSDCDAVAAAIQWVLEHPAAAEAMGERGQLAVRNEYNWDRQGAKLVSIYERELQPSARAGLVSGAGSPGRTTT